MSILQQGIVPASAGGYEIANSLRLNDDDSAYLSWTPSSAGNRKTWTWSGWVKRGNLSVKGIFGSNGSSDSTYFDFRFNGDNALQIGLWSGTGYESTPIFRDTSAWYHIVVAFDTTQSTQADRCKVFVNGSLISYSTNSFSLNTDYGFNNNTVQTVGAGGNSGSKFDGYLAEVNFIDGQALDPSNFGETGDYGEWKPIKYTGTYGSNGFYLDFENSGSLGADVSGNGNNWTPNNLAATDQMLDSPTNNFATWNPLVKTDASYSEGNLKTNSSTSWDTEVMLGSMALSGKVYWEIVGNSNGNGGVGGGIALGIATKADSASGTLLGHSDPDGWGFLAHDSAGSRKIYHNDTGTTYGSAGLGSTAYDKVLQIAVDTDAGKVWFGVNNTWNGSPSLGTSPAFTDSDITTKDIFPAGNGNNLWDFIANFGQDSSFAGNKTAQGNTDDNGYGDFYYAPPTGYLALCTQNLPDATVIPSEHFSVVTYNGTGGEQTITSGFATDFAWIKRRDGLGENVLMDKLRLTGSLPNRLWSNLTTAESTAADGQKEFSSTGIVLDGSGSGGDVNNGSGRTYVAWQWKANGAGVSNTNGTITSTVSANQDAGFSIVSWVGTDGADSVGHGLDSAPELLILKNRSRASTWRVHDNISGKTNGRMDLNGTGAENTTNHQITFQSTTFTFNTDSGAHEDWNQLNENIIAYCFHSVDGFSKVGSYTGNGSTDGTFVYTGFRPAYVMIKRTDSAGDWYIWDAVRNEYNLVTRNLVPNKSNAEFVGTSNYTLDFTSNGFKHRGSGSDVNASGGSHIYYAVAENPFKHTNAR